VLAALSVAGDQGADRFVFNGFLSSRASQRAAELAQAASAAWAQILYEAPHRIEGLADALAAACPTRRVTLCRELTKQFESVATLQCAGLPAWLSADKHRQRGEFVLVLHASPPATSSEADPAQFDELLTVLLRELPLKQAVAIAAELSAAPRNMLYERALALRKDVES
jgi:16S rRNA (cytidine1402-2'-O)-methyltransferase